MPIRPRPVPTRPEAAKKSDKLGLKELIAMGVGGMIGGGIFSVLGLAVGISGHAAPFAFALGSLIAFAAGYSYVRLALAFRDDGASFTYLERAFPARPGIAGVAGWTVIVGYIGTLALYAFTFGAYGADLIGFAGSAPVRMGLSVGVLLLFMAVNLAGVRSAGSTEDLVVYGKILLLAVFAAAGVAGLKADHLTPVFDRGRASVFMAGALIFVAYEGFQLITNAVCETRDPERDVPRGIFGSIAVTSAIYVTLALVAVGTLTPAELLAAKEYALAAAAKPVLGEVGTVLVAFAALLATSSAINATVFGASRMMAEMAGKGRMPSPLALRNRAAVPWMAVVALTGLALAFTLAGGLEVIAAFSSMTFLLVSMGVAAANLRLRARTRSNLWLVLAGLALTAATALLLVVYLWRTDREALVWIGAIYAAVAAAELLLGHRRR